MGPRVCVGFHLIVSHATLEVPTDQANGPVMSFCVKCSEYTKRSRRQGLFDFLFFLIGYYPYRCLRCGRRTHLRQRV